MARILISEPHYLVRDMLERLVVRLGHEPAVFGRSAAERLADANALVVEPAAPAGAALARAASIAAPGLPLICASVAAPPAELERLGVVWTACLVKPYTCEQLGSAIERALATST